MEIHKTTYLIYYFIVLCLLDIIFGFITNNVISILISIFYFIMFFDFYRKASLVDITYKKMDVAEDNENQPEESIFIAKIEQNYYLKILYVTGLVLLHLFLLIGAFDIILDPAWTKFPEKCTQPIGCTRVYYDNTSNRYGTQVENITFNNSNLNQIIEDWQKTNLQTNVKLKSDNFYHFTFTTLVLGYGSKNHKM